MTLSDYDIVGAGIVGLATSLMLMKRYPALRIAVLEKESKVAQHQSGHNSGVIHAGIYYQPESLKARLCLQGGRQLIDFCNAHGISYECCGNVVVATNQRELETLDELHRRGITNAVRGLRYITSRELREIEPHATGLAALHSPNTCIVDYGRVANAMADDLQRQGVDLLTAHEVVAIQEGDRALTVRTARETVRAAYLVNCAGLYSDAIACLLGMQTQVRIIPFRGEYYVLRPDRRGLVRGLIYPVPDPQFPFLGVHFTRTVHGQVEAGPNAVLALAREGYTRTTIDARELLQTVAHPGFWRLARRYYRTGFDEFKRSFSKASFAAALQRLVPEVQAGDLLPAGAGVRAQAVGPTGALLDDFVIVSSPRAVHVLNAPSPAATASLAIGDYIAEVATEQFALA